MQSRSWKRVKFTNYILEQMRGKTPFYFILHNTHSYVRTTSLLPVTLCNLVLSV